MQLVVGISMIAFAVWMILMVTKLVLDDIFGPNMQIKREDGKWIVKKKD